MPGRIPHGSVREAVKVLVPLGQQVEHVGSDQRNADAALPAIHISTNSISSVVIHKPYTHTHSMNLGEATLQWIRLNSDP